MRQRFGLTTARAYGARVALFAGSMAALAACTLITASDADQCSSDGDCSSKGDAFAGRVCRSGVCVAPTSAGGGGAGSGGSAAGGASACTNDGCSTSTGVPAICRKSDMTCVQLTSQDCLQVIGDYKSDNAIVVGLMAPLVGDYKSSGVPIAQGAQLAFEELATNVVGLPGGAGGKPRPLVLVACHDLDDPIRTAKHLAEDLRVPAILGPAFSGVTIKVVSGVTIPDGVLAMSASATSPSITDLPGKMGLVWRTCPSDAIQAIPLAGLVPALEAQVRAAQKLAPGDQIRVAMTVKSDAYGTGLASNVTPLLEFNGKDVTANGANFFSVQYDDPAVNPNVDFSTTVNDLVAFAPHVVIALGTNEGVTKIEQQLEANWPSTGTPPPRPLYLFPDGGEIQELLDQVGNTSSGAGEDLRKRVRGTFPGHTTPNQQAFNIRYKQRYAEEPGPYADNAYDAAYLLAYAALAVGANPITGASLSTALGKLVPPGTQLDVGPGSITKVFTALENNATVDFNGASGPLDFDLSTGEARADINVWCVGRDTNGKAVFVDSGQYYDAAMGAIVGTSTCN